MLRHTLRQSGGGRGNGKSKPPKGRGQAALSSAAQLQQRVAVRWTYTKNRGDGQWGAHGRYIERESATLEIERNIGENERSIEQSGQDNGGVSDRTAGRRPRAEVRHGPALRQSHPSTDRRPTPPRTVNALRGLSGVPVVRNTERSALLLSPDAFVHLDGGGADGDCRLRRGGGSESGEAGPVRGAVTDPVFGSAARGGKVAKTLRDWQAAGDQHLFKVILSPEFGDRLNLQSVTWRWVSAMEKDLGTRLQWLAVEHHNTANPHVHVAIRGLDDQGHLLKIDPKYIRAGSRARAQEVATRDLGLRTASDIRAARERQIVQQRFTDLDRMLVKKSAQTNHAISFDGPIPRSAAARELRLAQIRRLAQLAAMGLAERKGSVTWCLNPSLENVLRLMQSSQDRQKVRSEHRQMISDPMAPVVATKLDQPGKRVAGCLVGTGLDEAADKPYMLIEGFDGKIHYVLQPPKMEMLRGEGSAEIGDFIAVEAFERSDPTGQKRTAIRVDVYGNKLSSRLVDQELRRGGPIAAQTAPGGSVAGAFQALALTRSRQRGRSR